MVVVAFVASVLVTRWFLSDSEVPDSAPEQRQTTTLMPTTTPPVSASVPVPVISSTSASPSAVPNPPCNQADFIELWVRAGAGTPAPEKATPTCAGKYALVLFEGSSVGVHGTQTALFERDSSGEGYMDVAWGSTSHGSLTVFDLQGSGLDVEEIRRTFPDKIVGG